MKLTLPPQYDFIPRFSRLAFASIISNIMVPISGLVDSAFLGHLPDISQLAGVILAAILFEYLYRVLNFLRSSTNGMTAIAVGKNNSKEILLVFLRNGFIALALGAIILMLQYPLQKLGFTLLSGTPDVKAAGIAYFNARIWAAPAVLINFVMIGWFLGKEMGSKILLLSMAGYLTNMVLDYLMIVQWGWESFGAGLATAISQYAALLVGLIFVALEIQWRDIPTVRRQVLNWQAFQATFAFNGDILIRTLVLVSALSIFTNLSAAMGTKTLAQNGLLLQILTLSHFGVQGIGFATQSFTGQFKGKGEYNKLRSLVGVAAISSLLFALPFALSAILFPHTIFSILTNHGDVIEDINLYTNWLIPLLAFNAIGLMLEGYFIGLTEGYAIRNAALIAIGLGFAPIATVAWYFQSNHLLWLAISLYMVMVAIVLGGLVPNTLRISIDEDIISSLPIEAESFAIALPTITATIEPTSTSGLN